MAMMCSLSHMVDMLSPNTSTNWMSFYIRMEKFKYIWVFIEQSFLNHFQFSVFLIIKLFPEFRFWYSGYTHF